MNIGCDDENVDSDGGGDDFVDCVLVSFNSITHFCSSKWNESIFPGTDLKFFCRNCFFITSLELNKKKIIIINEPNANKLFLIII